VFFATYIYKLHLHPPFEMDVKTPTVLNRPSTLPNLPHPNTPYLILPSKTNPNLP
jgi:hypothetical protein